MQTLLFYWYLDKLHIHARLCKAQVPILKAIIHYNTKFFFLNNWVVNQ